MFSIVRVIEDGSWKWCNHEFRGQIIPNLIEKTQAAEWGWAT